MASATLETTRVDSRGRVTLPRQARQRLDLKPGDIVLVEVEPEGKVARVAKIVNPFDVLVVEAVALDNKDLTVSDKDVAKRLGLDSNAEPLEIDDQPA